MHTIISTSKATFPPLNRPVTENPAAWLLKKSKKGIDSIVAKDAQGVSTFYYLTRSNEVKFYAL